MFLQYCFYYHIKQTHISTTRMIQQQLSHDFLHWSMNYFQHMIVNMNHILQSQYHLSPISLSTSIYD